MQIFKDFRYSSVRVLPSLIFIFIIFSCDQGIDPQKEREEESIVIDSSTTTLISEPKQEIQDSTLVMEDTVRTHVFRTGETLWDLCRGYYGNRHYSAVVSIYNEIEDVHDIADGTIIKVPPLDVLLNDPKLGLNQVLSDEIDKVLKARELFMKHRNTLSDLREGVEGRTAITLPEKTKTGLQLAVSLINESIDSLNKLNTDSVKAPRKTIGQLRSLAKNLDNLSQGNHDGPYKYDLDMVHQRLVQAMKNSISWAQNDYQ